MTRVALPLERSMEWGSMRRTFVVTPKKYLIWLFSMAWISWSLPIWASKMDSLTSSYKRMVAREPSRSTTSW